MYIIQIPSTNLCSLSAATQLSATQITHTPIVLRTQGNHAMDAYSVGMARQLHRKQQRYHLIPLSVGPFKAGQHFNETGHTLLASQDSPIDSLKHLFNDNPLPLIAGALLFIGLTVALIFRLQEKKVLMHLPKSVVQGPGKERLEPVAFKLKKMNAYKDLSDPFIMREAVRAIQIFDMLDGTAKKQYRMRDLKVASYKGEPTAATERNFTTEIFCMAVYEAYILQFESRPYKNPPSPHDILEEAIKRYRVGLISPSVFNRPYHQWLGIKLLVMSIFEKDEREATTQFRARKAVKKKTQSDEDESLPDSFLPAFTDRYVVTLAADPRDIEHQINDTKGYLSINIGIIARKIADKWNTMENLEDRLEYYDGDWTDMGNGRVPPRFLEEQLEQFNNSK